MDESKPEVGFNVAAIRWAENVKLPPRTSLRARFKRGCDPFMLKGLLFRLAVAADQKGVSWKSTRRLANEMGCDQAVVSRMLKTLETLKLIERGARKSGARGMASATTRVLFDVPGTSVTDAQPSVQTSVTDDPGTSVTDVGESSEVQVEVPVEEPEKTHTAPSVQNSPAEGSQEIVKLFKSHGLFATRSQMWADVAERLALDGQDPMAVLGKIADNWQTWVSFAVEQDVYLFKKNPATKVPKPEQFLGQNAAGVQAALAFMAVPITKWVYE